MVLAETFSHFLTVRCCLWLPILHCNYVLNIFNVRGLYNIIQTMYSNTNKSGMGLPGPDFLKHTDCFSCCLLLTACHLLYTDKKNLYSNSPCTFLNLKMASTYNSSLLSFKRMVYNKVPFVRVYRLLKIFSIETFKQILCIVVPGREVKWGEFRFIP